MTMPAPEYAARTMKARTESTCPRCRGLITVGQQIGLLPGTGWCHVLCIIGHRPPA